LGDFADDFVAFGLLVFGFIRDLIFLKPGISFGYCALDLYFPLSVIEE